PITRYFDVDNFIESLETANDRFEKGHKTMAKMSMASAALKNMDLGMFRKYILPVLMDGDYESLSELHHKMIMIGSMHFMDPYNFDLERVKRCVIHYATPDGRIVPFCTMNTIHRQTIEKRFAKPLDASKLTPLADIEGITGKTNFTTIY
ncbi:MAG: radical SAM protein, partial [Candidatus Bathyarchaeota archaeon]|nr:radical SAM protein [Candidatus Bathyarchaeota archaeon]